MLDPVLVPHGNCINIFNYISDSSCCRFKLKCVKKLFSFEASRTLGPRHILEQELCLTQSRTFLSSFLLAVRRKSSKGIH
jgi:hypothetical protein